MGKNSRKVERLIDDAHELCDAAEEIAGQRAPSVSLLNARLLYGSKAEFDKAVTGSEAAVSWTEVHKMHAEAMEEPEDDENDEDDEDRRAERRCGT
jgi:hypothetical protein